MCFKRISKKNDKGLVLLHGKPGTGKTSYMRYLIASLKKDVIFLPPNMAGAITNPNLISILIDNPNSIFVIEDAENIVVDREKDGSSPVSALLNISDGLLSDCLNIQVICSFNTDISKIDNALMRKGRLIRASMIFINCISDDPFCFCPLFVNDILEDFDRAIYRWTFPFINIINPKIGAITFA